MRHRRGGGNVGALVVCQSDNVAPYWVTHPFARRMTAWNRFVVRMSEYLGKSRQHTVCKTSQHPVGEAADRILFVDDQGPVEQARHHAAGEGGIAAHAEHDIGAALEEGDQQGGRQQQLFQQALATHATHADPHHVDARRRDYARFQPGARTEPEYLPAARAQRVGHRKRRVDVTAGAAGHDHERTVQGGHQKVFPRIICRCSQSMRNRMATARQLAMMPLPPNDRNGSVSPLVGRRPTFTPMLMSACTPIQIPMPCATSAQKLRSSWAARWPIRKALTMSQPNRPITTTTPTKPNSSAITAIRKSVCASGR